MSEKVNSIRKTQGVEIHNRVRINNITHSSMDMNFLERNININLTGEHIDTYNFTIPPDKSISFENGKLKIVKNDVN